MAGIQEAEHLALVFIGLGFRYDLPGLF